MQGALLDLCWEVGLVDLLWLRCSGSFWNKPATITFSKCSDTKALHGHTDLVEHPRSASPGAPESQKEPVANPKSLPLPLSVTGRWLGGS